MSQTVFERLMGSYKGMRKRTWQAHVLSEAKNWERDFGAPVDMDRSTAISQLNAVKSGILKARNKTPEVQGGGDAYARLQGAGVGSSLSYSTGVVVRSFGVPVIVSNEKIDLALSIIDAKLKKYEEESSQGGGGLEDQGGAAQAPIAAPISPEQAAGVDFLPSTREAAEAYIERATDGNVDAKPFLDKILSTILTPLSKSKLGKLFSGRPDISTQIQKQLVTATGSVLSMASKVEEVKLADGSTRKVIRSSRMTAEDRDTSKVVTLRGDKGSNGVYFGRSDVAEVDRFKDLQDYATDYDDKNYGLTLGRALTQFAEPLYDARILPDGLDVSKMSAEDFDKLDLAAQKSLSVGVGSGENDLNGKLAEDTMQLSLAVMSGNRSLIKEAFGELKKRLERIGSVDGQDLEHLESTLTSGEFRDMEQLLEGTKSLKSDLKKKIVKSIKKSQKVLKLIGASKISAVGRPSQGSAMGDKQDVSASIKGQPSEFLSDVVEEDGSFGISMKEMEDESSDTPLGGGSVHNAYGDESEKYQQLQEEHLQRAIESGAIDDKQADLCRKVREDDASFLAKLGEQFGSLTKPNTKNVKTYIGSLIKRAGEVGFTSVADRKLYVDNLNEIMDSLDSDNPRKASMKLFQLHRLSKAQKDPSYARAMYVNDAILSMGTFKNEVICRNSPTNVSLSKSHAMLSNIARDAFDPRNSISIGISTNSMKDSNGRVLASNRVAGKEKKQFVEGRVTGFGLTRYFDSHKL